MAVWVAKIDDSAVRNTRDVDILLRREDLEMAKDAMEAAGFIYRHVRGIDMFLDGPGSKVREAVHVLFAGEKVRPDSLAASAEITETEMAESEATGRFSVISLEALVRMKLTSHRDKDRTHLRDMIDVGLIDNTWPARYPGELGQRLQRLFDNPEG